jgi:hypothetical protein
MMRRPSGLGLQHAAIDLAIGKTIQPASGCGENGGLMGFNMI